MEISLKCDVLFIEKHHTDITNMFRSKDIIEHCYNETMSLEELKAKTGINVRLISYGIKTMKITMC